MGMTQTEYKDKLTEMLVSQSREVNSMWFLNTAGEERQRGVILGRYHQLVANLQIDRELLTLAYIYGNRKNAGCDHTGPSHTGDSPWRREPYNSYFHVNAPDTIVGIMELPNFQMLKNIRMGCCPPSDSLIEKRRKRVKFVWANLMELQGELDLRINRLSRRDRIEALTQGYSIYTGVVTGRNGSSGFVTAFSPKKYYSMLGTPELIPMAQQAVLRGHYTRANEGQGELHDRADIHSSDSSRHQEMLRSAYRQRQQRGQTLIGHQYPDDLPPRS
jgi:hypothetical protein